MFKEILRIHADNRLFRILLKAPSHITTRLGILMIHKVLSKRLIQDTYFQVPIKSIEEIG